LKKFLINKPEVNEWRLDKWLKINFSSLNQSFIEKNLRKGNIKVNNKKKLSKYKLQIHDEIIIFNYSDEAYKNIIKQFSKKIIPTHYNDLFKSSIIYENDDFIIINKWSGIATQGGSKINISIDHIIKNISEKYNLVHRLDRETSGLLIIAKNIQTTKIFGKLFKDHLIFKLYLAICEGSPKNNESEINLSIADKKDSNKSSNSVTRYKVFQSKNSLSNIIFTPKTGKTHQLRIVAKHLGCPIVGDTKYNKQHKYNFEKLKLNAHVLSFTINENNYEFIADLPDDFKIFLKKNNFKIINKEDLKIFL
jgi:23S rRNA pseudouridine955/2504/2580 synthase